MDAENVILQPRMALFVHGGAARIIRIRSTTEGCVVRETAANWRDLTIEANRAVRAQGGVLEFPGQWDCPPGLMLSAQFPLRDHDWITLSEAVEVGWQHDAPIEYSNLAYQINAALMDVLIDLTAGPYRFRRWVRQVQVHRYVRHWLHVRGLDRVPAEAP